MDELEAELEEMVAQSREMFVLGQDSVKKELINRFPIENFSWMDDIFLDEEGEDKDRQDEERKIKDNLLDPTSTILEIDDHATDQEEETNNDSPAS